MRVARDSQLAAVMVSKTKADYSRGCTSVGNDLRVSWQERCANELWVQDCHMQALKDVEICFIEGCYGL